MWTFSTFFFATQHLTAHQKSELVLLERQKLVFWISKELVGKTKVSFLDRRCQNKWRGQGIGQKMNHIGFGCSLPCPSLSYSTRRHLGGTKGIGGLSVHDNLCYFCLGVGFQDIVGKLLSKAFFLCIWGFLPPSRHCLLSITLQVCLSVCLSVRLRIFLFFCLSASVCSICPS
jgi:hypothetical protein